MRKLAIVVTHPIQYYAPVFKLLTERQNIAIKVFYTWGNQSTDKFDPGFGKKIEWDLPLLSGYDYEWVENTSTQPGSHHFKGIVTPTLTAQIEAYAADAVMAFGWSYQGHLQLIRYFKNKLPVFFRGDSTLLDEKSDFKQLLRSIYLRWVYKHVDAAFYTGQNNEAYFKKYGLKQHQLIFAPHAVDNQRFAVDYSTEANLLRQKYHIGPDDILILFAGKLERKKSPLLLLNAFKKLNKPNAHLLFAGNGVLEADLKKAASGNQHIHFIGFQNQTQMPALYQSADLFVLPSAGPGESWGLAINEAMACGKAIIASNKCGAAADLITAQNGIIFKSEDESELVDALKNSIASKERLQLMGANSQSIIAGWNFTAIASAIENKLNGTFTGTQQQ